MKPSKSKKRLMLLGSTGSIGENTLDVIRHLPEQFEIVALSCHRNLEKLVRQIEEFSPQAVAITGEVDWDALPGAWPNTAGKVYRGEGGLQEMIEELGADLVVNGISGSRGLLPSLKTLEAKKNLAIANKETMVMAGTLVVQSAKKNRVALLPVDSENFAIFCLLQQVGVQNVKEIILTASGGPFLDLPFEQWKDVRLEQALKHPNWDMGPKNTIDSATMANKGIELIEAHYLFQMEVSRIQVVIHPQSTVHSLVRTLDGFLYAQISQPDMRMVIQNALTYPALNQASYGTMDLMGKHISFLPVDFRKYRLLHLAYQVAAKEGPYPVVYNAANEVAFEYFLNEAISFSEIPIVVEETLNSEWAQPASSVEQVLHVDELARRKAAEIVKIRKRAVS